MKNEKEDTKEQLRPVQEEDAYSKGYTDGYKDAMAQALGILKTKQEVETKPTWVVNADDFAPRPKPSCVIED